MRHRRNEKNRRVYIKAACTMLMLFLLPVNFTACTTFNSFKSTFIDTSGVEAEPTITIGVFEPQTGRNAEKGRDELKGIELANSIYNNVDGYKVVLSKVDTQSSVSATKTAVNGLIKMKPVAMIGSAGEATSLAASELVEPEKIPTITPSATNPLITQGNKYYFRATITESQMGQGLAEYACEQIETPNIGIITLKNDSSIAAMTDSFESKVKDILGKKTDSIKYQEEISAAEEDMEAALRKMRRRDVNVCFMPLGAENMDIFFTMVEEKGYEGITFLGIRSWGEAAFIKMMEKHPGIKIVFPYESVLSGTDSTSDAITEEAQRFQIEYANRYGSDDIPTYNAALGYDAYLIIINAIHNSKSIEGKDIRTALMSLDDLKCSTGSFSFDASGNVVRPVTLSTLKDGKPVNEYVSESEAKSKKLEDVEEQQQEGENGISGKN